MLISVVSPVYKGQESVPELCKRLFACKLSSQIDLEIILVNDASPDASWEVIRELANKDRRIKGINLSRNFGQHYAITAGLEHAHGDWIVVMDCDLQDRPEEIPRLHEKSIEGYDIVLASRVDRSDPYLKRLFSYFFYRVLNWLTGAKYDHNTGNFGIYHRKAIDAILKMGDSIRYFPTMVEWVGFRKTSLEVHHESRVHGKSTYSLKKLLHLALDIILSYSEKPIRLTIKIGLIISFLSILATIVIFVRATLGLIEVPGYASLIISIWFFSGLIIFNIGMVGLYVGKTFQAAKNRPAYIASEKVNL